MTPQPPSSGPERVSRRTVSFAHPFTLGRSEDILPSGNYQVETVEQSMDAAQSTVHVRKSTTLMIPTATGFRCREIPAAQLEDALAQDSDRPLEEPSENPDLENADGHE